MMVQNSVEFDTRVRKEAESLAKAGYDVRVFGRTAPHLPDLEEVGGVVYERVELDRGLGAVLRIPWPLRLRGRRRTPKRPSGIGQRMPRLLPVIDELLGHLLRRIDAVVAEASRRYGRAVYLLSPLIAVRRALALVRNTLVKPALTGITGGWRLARRGANRRLRRAIAPVGLHVDWCASVAPRLARFAPDVVHAHDLNTLLAGWRHKRRHACRLIYDAHELELHRNQQWTRYKRAIARSIEFLGIRSSDGVITVSPLIADDLARTYRVRRPLVVLNSPPLRTRDLEAVLDLRALAALDGEQRLTVYVGGVLYRRGHEQLVEALAHLPDCHHVGVLGPRKPKNEAPLLGLAATLGVGDRLHFFGAVPAHQVPATLACADATIIPIPNVCRSYDYALPNKLFDAVMAGVPIGVSRLRHMSDFVTEHELGLVVDETDPRSIARGIEQLVEASTPGLADEARLASLQLQVAWEVQEAVLLDLYRRVLGPAGIERRPAVSAAVAPSSHA